MKNMFFIADLCLVTDSKNIIHKNRGKFVSFSYKEIDRKIFYYKNNKYFDIDTNVGYNTDCQEVGTYFINPTSIETFDSFLKQNKINYNKSLNKQRVKKLYEDIVKKDC